MARRAAEAGVDLTFLRTIPGSIGGAVRMNAGCYGSYVADHLMSARAVTRAGEIVTLTPDDLQLAYRHSDLPEGWVIVEATFEGPAGDPEALAAKMADQIAKRDARSPPRIAAPAAPFAIRAGFPRPGGPMTCMISRPGR